MVTVSTCLWFDSQALAAAQFYTSVVPNSRITHVMKDPGGNPHTQPGQVLYVEFELDGQRFATLNGGPHFTLDEAASVVLSCETQAEADDLWSRFTAHGTPSVCGWLTDQFGLSWQIVPQRVNELQSGDAPDASRRAVQAMMGMRRLDSAVMERIASGARGYTDYAPGLADAPAGPDDPRLERIERTVLVEATPETVWKLVSEPGWWVNEGTIRPHEIRSADGRHEVTDPVHGTFVVSEAGTEPGHYIAWRWEQSSPQMQDDTGLTTLTQFWVLPDGDATRVVVIESGFLDADLPHDRLRDVHSGNVHGWELELAALRAHAEALDTR